MSRPVVTWTEPNVALLKGHVAKGMTGSQLVAALAADGVVISEAAVSLKVRRLGLKLRGSDRPSSSVLRAREGGWGLRA